MNRGNQFSLIHADRGQLTFGLRFRLVGPHRKSIEYAEVFECDVATSCMLLQRDGLVNY